MVLRYFITFLGVAVQTPIDQARDVLVLIFLVFATSFSRSRRFVVMWFLEALLLYSILDVEAVSAASLVADEEFARSVIQADAGDVSLGDVMEDVLQTAIGRVPNLHTGRMSCDKSVEDGVVEDAEAGILIRKVVIHRLVIIVEDQTASTDNDSFWRLSHSQSMNLI